MCRSLLYSRNLAFGFGILLPLMQTIRVWKHLTEPGYVIHWVDDYLFGGFLLFGAFQVLRYKEQGKGCHGGRCLFKYIGAVGRYETG